MKRRRSLGNDATLPACKFPTAKAKSQAIASFLRAHGDDLPEAAIKKTTAVDVLNTWVTFCDGQGIAAAMRYEHNDWYLCTLKNAAVRPELRGRGIGSRLYQQTAGKALRNKDCKVLAADVTTANVPSVRALERAGFTAINEFCWSAGQKPAKILHYVRVPPKGGTCE